MLSTDPIDLLRDDLTWDLVIPHTFATGAVGVQQNIRMRLLSIRGEWFLNLDDGLPYFERNNVSSEEALLGGQYDEVKLRSAIAEAIIDAPAVVAIVSMEVSFDPGTRNATVNAELKIQFDDLTDTLTVAETFEIAETL